LGGPLKSFSTRNRTASFFEVQSTIGDDFVITISPFFDESGKFKDHDVVVFGGVVSRQPIPLVHSPPNGDVASV
jgi:hypothetical protein